MITIKEPPRSSDHVVQMKSRETGKWVDVVTGLGIKANALVTLERWRRIHPGREFQLVKRCFTEEVIGD